MKIKFLLASITLVLFSACGGSTGTSKKEEKKQAQDNLVRANQIIGYTNNVIEESNHMIGWAESNERQVKLLSDIAAQPSLAKKTINLTFFMSNMMFFNYDLKKGNSNQILDLRVVPEGAFDAEDKEYFESSAIAYHDCKDRFKGLYDKIQVYVKEEDFKDDKGALGKAYSDSVNIYFNNMMVILSEMTDFAVEKGQEAELLTLEDSPLKEVILLMREQMKLSNNLLHSFEAFKEGEGSKEDLLKLYDEYETVNAKNVTKAETMKLTDMQQRRFTTFMDSNDKVRGNFKVAARNVRNGEKIEYTTLSSARIYTESLVRHYNDVIK